MVIALLAPAIALIVRGYAHARDGIAWDNAIPVPVSMIVGIPLPKVAYVDAAASLRGADPHNGEAILMAAEARYHAGQPTSAVLPDVRSGLELMPGSARGWLLLGVVAGPRGQALAAPSLEQSIYLGPREYYLIGPRLLVAAKNWDGFDHETKELVLKQVRMAWDDPLLRNTILVLSESPQGALLISRAFAPDEVRTINRWLRREHLRTEAS